MEKEYSKEFTEVYDKVNSNLKKEKRSFLKKINDIRVSEMLLYFLSFISLVAFFIAPVNDFKLMFFSVGMAMIVVALIFMIVNEIKIFGIKLDYKKEILKDFAKTISNDWEYKVDEPISEVYYKKSGFNQTYTKIYSDGYLKAKRNNKEINMGNISVMKDITKSNKNITVEAFNGIFAHTKIDSYVDEIDVMKTNSKNNIKQKLEIVDGKLYMYSENINKARQVLNNNLLQMIIDLEKELGIDIELMINENDVFFRFFTANTLSTNLFGSEDEKKALYDYYRISQFIINFTGELEKEINR